MYKSYSMELAGRTLTVDIDRVAKQANGAAFMHYGDTVVLSTATASEKPREGIDFFPLSVEYEEKMYAVGKIPGGFNKREGKASEHAILTSRVIDRPMRPLFPKDYRNDVTLNNMVMSVDPECRPELVAMLGSAIATAISPIFQNPPRFLFLVGFYYNFLLFSNQEIAVGKFYHFSTRYFLFRLIYHRFCKNAITFCRIVDKNVSYCAD